MTTVTSNIKNNFLLGDIMAEVRRMHKMTGERMLFVGISETSYTVDRDQNAIKHHTVQLTNIHRRD